MDIFSVFTLCGGLAFFLYGMTVMSKSLEKMAGGKLERMLKRMTSNPTKSLLLGAGITIAIQSSSAMTVMLVGLVNSGVMELGQTVGIIMGSNIGTTLTAWILSLAGLETDNMFVRLLKPESFSPILAIIGVVLIMASKKQKRRDIGRIMVGFAILMYGMDLMKDAVAPLADSPKFSSLLTAFNNPLLGVLVGTLFTALIQASAASVAILQALSLTGSITFGMAIPIIMGQNIGTCITALLSSIGVNRNAKRVAAIHISFNVIGTTVFLVLFYGGNLLFHFEFLTNTIDALGIAVCHSIFNVATTLMLLPFSRQLVRLAERVVPNKAQTEQIAFLDPLLLRTPGVAINECSTMANQMGQLARENLRHVLRQFSEYSDAREVEIRSNEDKLDIYKDRLGGYLVEISQHGTSESDIRVVSCLLHTISDFERLGDHVLNLQQSAWELHEKGIQFVEGTIAELRVLCDALEHIMDRTLECFVANDTEKALEIEPLEETIDYLIEEIRTRHIHRLHTGQCAVERSFILNDMLANFERVSDHCSNIAISILEEHDGKMNRHAYLRTLKRQESFAASTDENLRKYYLPPMEDRV